MKFVITDDRSAYTRGFAELEDRVRLVEAIGLLVSTVRDSGFKPYKPNERDDMYWTVDWNNNWKVAFFKDDPYAFEIRYRYNGGHILAEEALASWICYRFGAKTTV